MRVVIVFTVVILGIDVIAVGGVFTVIIIIIIIIIVVVVLCNIYIIFFVEFYCDC